MLLLLLLFLVLLLMQLLLRLLSFTVVVTCSTFTCLVYGKEEREGNESKDCELESSECCVS